MFLLFVIKKYSRIFLVIIVFISNPSKVLSDPLPQLGDPYSEVLPISNEEIIGFMSYQSLQNGNYIINDPLVVSYINYLGNLLSRNLLLIVLLTRELCNTQSLKREFQY